MTWMVDIHEYPYTHTNTHREEDSYVTHKVSKFYKRTDEKRAKAKRETTNEKEKLCAMRVRMVRATLFYFAWWRSVSASVMLCVCVEMCLMCLVFSHAIVRVRGACIRCSVSFSALDSVQSEGSRCERYNCNMSSAALSIRTVLSQFLSSPAAPAAAEVATMAMDAECVCVRTVRDAYIVYNGTCNLYTTLTSFKAFC